MSLINKELADFSVQAYQNEAFKTVTRADILGKWSVYSISDSKKTNRSFER